MEEVYFLRVNIEFGHTSFHYFTIRLKPGNNLLGEGDFTNVIGGPVFKCGIILIPSTGKQSQRCQQNKKQSTMSHLSPFQLSEYDDHLLFTPFFPGDRKQVDSIFQCSDR